MNYWTSLALGHIINRLLVEDREALGLQRLEDRVGLGLQMVVADRVRICKAEDGVRSGPAVEMSRQVVEAETCPRGPVVVGHRVQAGRLGLQIVAVGRVRICKEEGDVRSVAAVEMNRRTEVVGHRGRLEVVGPRGRLEVVGHRQVLARRRRR